MFKLQSKNLKRITLDDSLFRFALEQDEIHGELSLKLLEQIEHGELEQAYISALTYAKIVGGYDQEEVARKVQVLLSHFPNLTIIPFDTKVAEQTANIQRKYGLSFDQAVLVATSMVSNCQLLISERKAILAQKSPILWWDLEELNALNDLN